MSEHYAPRHRRHVWSAIREYRTPQQTPRHATDLGATGFDVNQLMRETFLDNPFSRSAR